MFGQLRWGRLSLDLTSLLTLYSWYRVIQIWFKTMTRETQLRSGKLSLDWISLLSLYCGYGVDQIGFQEHERGNSTLVGEVEFGFDFPTHFDSGCGVVKVASRP